MQCPIRFIEDAQKERIKIIESQFKNHIASCSNHEMIECPFCHYVTKTGKFTGKIFKDSNSFKCFSCGIWRRF